MNGGRRGHPWATLFIAVVTLLVAYTVFGFAVAEYSGFFGMSPGQSQRGSSTNRSGWRLPVRWPVAGLAGRRRLGLPVSPPWAAACCSTAAWR